MATMPCLSHGSRSVEILSNRNGKMQPQTQTQMHNATCRCWLTVDARAGRRM